MEEFTRQFGIDGRLLFSQMVNFGIVLIALRYFAYSPIAKIIKKRRDRIEEGLMKADESDKRLAEVQILTKKKIQSAEQTALNLIREMEQRAKDKEITLLESSKKKGEVLLREAVNSIEAEREKTRLEIEKEARVLVRNAVMAIANIESERLDEALITKALEQSR